MGQPPSQEAGAPEPGPTRRLVRLAGWLVAANALLLLGASALPAPVRDAAGQFAAWCGLG